MKEVKKKKPSGLKYIRHTLFTDLPAIDTLFQMSSTGVAEQNLFLSWKMQGLLRVIFFLQVLLFTKSYGFLSSGSIRSFSYEKDTRNRYSRDRWTCSNACCRLPAVSPQSNIDDFGLGVSVIDDSNLQSTEAETRLYAQDFFNELRGTNKAVAVKDLASSYYFESMLHEGSVTRKQLADIVGGKRLMGFEVFYDICIALNKLQDEFYSSNDYDDKKSEKLEETRTMFDNLRGLKPKLSVSVFKSLYYFDEMIKDGIISKESFSMMCQGKRQLDFEAFFRIRTEVDNLIEEYDSPNVLNEQNVEHEKLGHKKDYIDKEISIIDGMGSKFTIDPALSGVEQVGAENIRRLTFTDDELENSRKSDEMENALRSAVSCAFNILSDGTSSLSLDEIEKWEVIDRLLTQGVIGKDTVNNLAQILGLKDKILLEDFIQFVGLLDEATGTGIMEVCSLPFRYPPILTDSMLYITGTLGPNFSYSYSFKRWLIIICVRYLQDWRSGRAPLSWSVP